MTFTLHCSDCDTTWDHNLIPGETLYDAAYVAAARHERKNLGKHCYFSAANFITLVKATPNEVAPNSQND